MEQKEQGFNSQEVNFELFKNLIDNTENISIPEILSKFKNLIKLVDGNKKIDDLAKSSIYIENAIGEIYFSILQKIDSEEFKKIDISGIDTELDEGDTNYSRFVEKLEKNGKNIVKQDIQELLGFLEKISNELYKNNFIQNNLNQILEKLSINNDKLKEKLESLNGLEESNLKEYVIDSVKKSVIEKEENDTKKESSNRNLKFEQNKFFRKLSKILKSDTIKIDYIKNLQEVDSNTTILTFHKVMKDEIINILSRLGINIKFSRKGFTSIKLPNGEKIVFIPTKDIGSTTNFSDFETYEEEIEIDDEEIITIENYLEQEGKCDIEYITKNTKGVFFLGGTDMTDLFKSKEGKESMVKLAEINSLLAFGSKAEFLLASDEDSLERIINGETPYILSTKYTGVGDKMNEILPQKAEIKYYGSNSEGGVQKEKSQNKNRVIMNLEAVQSGASMKDTGNYVYRKETIDGEEKVVVYYPTKRGKDGDFEKKDVRFIFVKEKKYEWLFESLNVVQTEMNLELSQINMKTKASVEDIVGNIPQNSVKSFLINIFEYRGKELAKFNRIETEPGKRPLIELNEELLKDEKLMKQAINLYKEVYGRIGYDEKYTDKEVYKIIENIIEKGGTWLLRQNNYKKIIGFIASIDLEKADEINSNIKKKLKEEIGNENKNYYIAETGSPEGERQEGDFQNWLKQIIKEKGNYIARTNLLDSRGKSNKKIIKMYQKAGFKIIKCVNDFVEKPGTNSGEKNSKIYLVYKNEK